MTELKTTQNKSMLTSAEADNVFAKSPSLLSWGKATCLTSLTNAARALNHCIDAGIIDVSADRH